MPLWSSEPAVHYAEAVPGAGVVSVGVRAGLLSPNSPAYVRIVKRLYVLDILDSFFFLFLLPAYCNSEGIPSVFLHVCRRRCCSAACGHHTSPCLLTVFSHYFLCSFFLFLGGRNRLNFRHGLSSRSPRKFSPGRHPAEPLEASPVCLH